MKRLSEMTAQEVAEASARAMWSGDKASPHLGMKLERVGPGEAVMTMSIAEFMLNGHGSCHGGYLFTLADSAFAFACNSHNQIVVAQTCSIAFLAPGRLGDRLTATAREVSRKGRTGLYDVSVVNQNGESLAEFRGLSRVVKGAHLHPEA